MKPINSLKDLQFFFVKLNMTYTAIGFKNIMSVCVESKREREETDKRHSVSDVVLKLKVLHLNCREWKNKIFSGSL